MGAAAAAAVRRARAFPRRDNATPTARAAAAARTCPTAALGLKDTATPQVWVLVAVQHWQHLRPHGGEVAIQSSHGGGPITARCRLQHLGLPPWRVCEGDGSQHPCHAHGVVEEGRQLPKRNAAGQAVHPQHGS